MLTPRSSQSPPDGEALFLEESSGGVASLYSTLLEPWRRGKVLQDVIEGHSDSLAQSLRYAPEVVDVAVGLEIDVAEDTASFVGGS
jgi:hypothetical protein